MAEQMTIDGSWERVVPIDERRRALVNECAEMVRTLEALHSAAFDASVYAKEGDLLLDKWHSRHCEAMGECCPICARECEEDEEMDRLVRESGEVLRRVRA